MTIKTFGLFLIITGITILSCKKETGGSTPNNPTSILPKKIVTTSKYKIFDFLNGISIDSILYDDAGRASLISTTYSSDTFKSHSYSLFEYDGINNLPLKRRYFLGNTYATAVDAGASHFLYDDLMRLRKDSAGLTTVYNFEYSTNTTIIIYNNSVFGTYLQMGGDSIFYDKENIVKKVFFDFNGDTTDTIIKSFDVSIYSYTSYPNPFYSVGAFNYYKGQLSKNLPTSINYTSNVVGRESYTKNFYYTFDSQQRLINSIEAKSTGDSIWKEYKY